MDLQDTSRLGLMMSKLFPIDSVTCLPSYIAKTKGKNQRQHWWNILIGNVILPHLQRHINLTLPVRKIKRVTKGNLQNNCGWPFQYVTLSLWSTKNWWWDIYMKCWHPDNIKVFVFSRVTSALFELRIPEKRNSTLSVHFSWFLVFQIS